MTRWQTTIAFALALLVTSPAAAHEGPHPRARLMMGTGITALGGDAVNSAMNYLPNSGFIGVELAGGTFDILVDAYLNFNQREDVTGTGTAKTTTTNSTTNWALGVSLRYSFMKPVRNMVVPYARVRGFFLQNLSEMETTGATRTLTETTTNGGGVQLGFGIEYNFTDHFALAGETGLMWVRTVPEETQQGGATTETTFDTVQFVFSLLFNFRL